jgi:hypothetical protein
MKKHKRMRRKAQQAPGEEVALVRWGALCISFRILSYRQHV